ncbi:CFEM domain-containing protein [Diaporthe helianthi]|uniref:CFEM domain-containing protein n=1 Tax=Diaporthe helianthi TaxID=158607 RepID=A0A2P5HI98_DIAHE|nr:CFEM domain-containing protein [Diaporthe helianthi]
MSYFWNMWDGDHVGRCINIYAMAWAHAIINIALDVWMLALPASQVWGLKMPFRRKLGVMVMFGLGIFITIVSCIRLRSLIGFAQAYPQKPTMDFFGVALWSALELTTGVTVACLPATRQVVVKYVPVFPDMLSRFSSRLSNGLSYVATGATKLSGGKSEPGKSAITTAKSTDVLSQDRTLQRITTEDPTDNKSIMMKALPPAPPRTLHSPGLPEGGGGTTRPLSVATTPSSLGDGFSPNVFDGPAGDSASEDLSDAGNDPEQGQAAVSPGGPLGPSGTRSWRPMSYPQPQTERTRWQ